MQWRGSFLLALAAAALAGAVSRSDDREKLERKQREVVQREAHYFALVKSRRPKIETSRGGDGSSFGGGGGRRGKWQGYETYGGVLTPPHEGRLYVVGAADLPETERFDQVSVHFYRKPAKGYGAEYVGQHALSKLIVFRLLRKSLGKSFKMPHEPVADPPMIGGEIVISLGHPYDVEKRDWVYWQMKFGALDIPPVKKAPKHWPLFKLGYLIRHTTDFGRYGHYWHGGPLVRVVDKKRVEILGLNFNGMEGVQRALPWAEVLRVRNEVIAAAARAED